MRDADEEIREIKKEIIESRGLIIKTSNLVNSLSADIKSIAKRQAGYERRFNANSVAAYILFALLSFVGIYFAFDTQMVEIEVDQEELSAEIAELRRELNDATSRAEQRARAESDAYQFYELIRQQQREEAVQNYEQVQDAELSRTESAFFRDTIDRFRMDLSVASYQEGLDFMRTGRYAEAEERLRKALEHEESGAHIPSVRYQLARSLRSLGRQTEAIVEAQKVANQEKDPLLRDDALLLVSQCAEEVGQYDLAIESLETLTTRHSRSSLAPDARRHLHELRLISLRGGADPN